MISFGLFNNKGGTGKSTVAINLAYEFAQKGSVLVIDADGQGNTSRFFENTTDNGIENFLLGRGDVPDAAETRYDNIHIISATAAINNALGAFERLTADERENTARQLITSHKDYDFIIVDLPPAMNTITEHIIGACDYVYVPIELGTFSVQGIAKVTKAIANYNAKLGGVFVNKFDRKNSADIRFLELLNEQLGNKVLKTVIPYSKVIKNSITYSCTAQEYMGWTVPARAFGELAKEISERIGE